MTRYLSDSQLVDGIGSLARAQYHQLVNSQQPMNSHEARSILELFLLVRMADLLDSMDSRLIEITTLLENGGNR